ncbi:hypothetical protein CBR_g23915 [Chara braunii]|uniref:AB hydrolase-1 domain-containing protein n=1 Tax=Chara braunii TaxID=69332 RepID=A0A388L594_CHABU|nr:hypothetical protein CBR_g23915 [Chara braunii]|eukprot:GBG77467.1 hypothetical protein CBR_g23915 [Chara braunii]
MTMMMMMTMMTMMMMMTMVMMTMTMVVMTDDDDDDDDEDDDDDDDDDDGDDDHDDDDDGDDDEDVDDGKDHLKECACPHSSRSHAVALEAVVIVCSRIAGEGEKSVGRCVGAGDMGRVGETRWKLGGGYGQGGGRRGNGPMLPNVRACRWIARALNYLLEKLPGAEHFNLTATAMLQQNLKKAEKKLHLHEGESMTVWGGFEIKEMFTSLLHTAIMEALSRLLGEWEKKRYPKITHIYAMCRGKLLRQVIGVPMGKNYCPPLACLLCVKYEEEFMKSLGGDRKLVHGVASGVPAMVPGESAVRRCGLVGVIAPIDDMTRIHAWVPESWARANMDRFVGGEYLKESPHPGMRRRKGGGEGTPAEPDDGRDPPWMSRGFGAEEDWGSQRRLYCESDPEKSQRKVESESDVETGGGGGGGGKRDIILLLQAFGPSAAFHWGAQVAVLYKRFDIIMPDLVFLGESTSRSEERSEVFQAVCVDGLLRFFGITSCHVVSMGYGGFVAFRLAQLFPEKIQKLIITSCPGPVLTRKDYEESLHDLEVENWIDIFLPSTAAALQKNMMAIMYKPPPIATWMLIGAMKEALKGSTQEKRELLQHLHAYLDSPEPEMPRLPSVKDILLIWGRYDRLFPLHLGERFQRHLGGRAKLKIVDQSGHSPSVESPREYNELIVKFLLGKEERWQPHHEAWKGREGETASLLTMTVCDSSLWTYVAPFLRDRWRARELLPGIEVRELLSAGIESLGRTKESCRTNLMPQALYGRKIFNMCQEEKEGCTDKLFESCAGCPLIVADSDGGILVATRWWVPDAVVQTMHLPASVLKIAFQPGRSGHCTDIGSYEGESPNKSHAPSSV